MNIKIAGIATQLKEVMTPEFKVYSEQVVKNAQALGKKLVSLGYKIATDGTINHLILWDLKPQKITGSKFEKACDFVCITLNKNCVPGDTSAVTPGGVRIGSPALTTGKMVETDFEKIGGFLDHVCKEALVLQEKSGPKLKDFVALLAGSEELKSIRSDVNAFTTTFPMPGFDPKEMKYQNPTGPEESS